MNARHLRLVPGVDTPATGGSTPEPLGDSYPASHDEPVVEDTSQDEVHEQALTLLARRPWTRDQLVRALERRGHDQCAVLEVVYGLEHVGLVDDVGYARDYIARKGRQRGRRALANELRGKGVGPEIVDAALQDPDVPDDELAARALVAKRLPAMARLEPHVRARRLAAQLTRRGFDAALVGRLLRELDEGPAGMSRLST